MNSILGIYLLLPPKLKTTVIQELHSKKNMFPLLVIKGQKMCIF